MSIESFNNPQIIPHLEQSVEHTVFSCSWVPCSTRFVTLGSTLRGEGVLQVYNMGMKELTKISEAKFPKSLKCGTFNASSLEDRHFTVADFEGTVRLFDLEDVSKPLRTFRAHDDLINAVDGVGGLGGGIGAPEIATASRDGSVKVWDPRVKDRPVACIQPRAGDKRHDAWCVAFGDCHSASDRVLAAGYDNGDVKMFDLRSMSLAWETQVPNGVCSLQFDRPDIEMNKLVACGLEGRFHVWDLRTKNPKKGFATLSNKCEKATLWNVAHLPQNRDLFMVTGGNGSVSLWKYDYPEKRVKETKENGKEGVMGAVKKLQEHQIGDQPVSCFSWSRDKSGLGLCTSFDQKVKVVIVTKLNKV